MEELYKGDKTVLKNFLITQQNQNVINHIANEDGLGLLQYYAKIGNLPMMDILLLLNVPINESEKKSNLTALILSAQKGHALCAERILDFGGHINQQDVRGKTALMHAIERVQKEVVELLVTRGSDMNLVDNAGKNAYHYALTFLSKEERAELGISEAMCEQAMTAFELFQSKILATDELQAQMALDGETEQSIQEFITQSQVQSQSELPLQSEIQAKIDSNLITQQDNSAKSELMNLDANFTEHSIEQNSIEEILPSPFGFCISQPVGETAGQQAPIIDSKNKEIIDASTPELTEVKLDKIQKFARPATFTPQITQTRGIDEYESGQVKQQADKSNAFNEHSQGGLGTESNVSEAFQASGDIASERKRDELRKSKIQEKENTNQIEQVQPKNKQEKGAIEEKALYELLTPESKNATRNLKEQQNKNSSRIENSNSYTSTHSGKSDKNYSHGSTAEKSTGQSDSKRSTNQEKSVNKQFTQETAGSSSGTNSAGNKQFSTTRSENVEYNLSSQKSTTENSGIKKNEQNDQQAIGQQENSLQRNSEFSHRASESSIQQKNYSSTISNDEKNKGKIHSQNSHSSSLTKNTSGLLALKDEGLTDTIAGAKGYFKNNPTVESKPFKNLVGEVKNTTPVRSKKDNDINQKNKMGQTSIMDCVSQGDFTKVQDHIIQGADVTIKDFKGESALTLAIRKGLVDIVKILIDAGAKTDEKNGDGLYPIHLCAQYDQDAILKHLLTLKTSKIGKDTTYKGMDLLMYAASFGSLQVVKTLLVLGLSPKAKDFKGRGAINYAKTNNHTEVVAFLSSLNTNKEGDEA